MTFGGSCELPLADNFFVVFTAYIAAFLPWTVFSAADFISDRWKHVRSTRRQGKRHLIFVSLPTGYIIFYIILQFLSCDYKEMFAAFVALFFSLLHLIRTTWGLWQLSVFKQWVSKSIVALHLMGVPFHHVSTAKVVNSMSMQTASDIADEIYINNSIVDNQLFEGEAQCHLVYGTEVIDPVDDVTSAFPIRANLVRKIISLPFAVLLDFIKFKLFNQEMRTFKVVPSYPIELWQNWAIVLASQGLAKWVRDFKTATAPEKTEIDSKEDLNRSFIQSRDYFAAEILSSAALHFLTSEELSSPLTLTSLPRKHAIDGRVSKTELFEEAVSRGISLPFTVPHVKNLRNTETLSRLGYGSYENRLERTKEGLPTRLETEIPNFSIEHLEWMTIILFLGTLTFEKISSDPTYKQEIYSKRSILDSFTITKKSFSEKLDEEIKTPVFSNRGENIEIDLDERDLPFENLRTQLGYGQDLDHSKTGLDIRNMNSFPLNRDIFLQTSYGNRLTLKVSDLIDNWIALVSGEQMAYLLNLKPSITALADWDPTSFSFDMFSAAGDLKEENDRSPTYMLQVMIERERLRVQYANKEHHYWHLDQSLTFMGNCVEFLRSEMAEWQHSNNTEGGRDLFKPKFQNFHINNGFLCSELKELGGVSQGLQLLLVTSKISDVLERRSVHVKLLYETQVHLKRAIMRTKAGPHSIESIILFLLGFPSIDIDLKPILRCRSSISRDRQDSQSSIIDIDGEPESESKEVQNYQLSFKILGGPQPFGVLLRMKFNETGKLRIHVSLAYHKIDAENVMFDWECWRDAFTARLDAKIQWQEEHGLQSSSLMISNNRIAESVKSTKVRLKGVGEHLSYWNGWFPSRFEMCIFELKSPRFLLEYKGSIAASYDRLMSSAESVADLRMLIRGETPTVMRYDDVQRVNLEHACSVVREELSDGEGMRADERSSISDEELIRIATEIMSTNVVRGAERAAFLFHIAAVEQGSVTALNECVKLLTGGQSMPVRVERAVGIVESFIVKYIKYEQEMEENGNDPSISNLSNSTTEKITSVGTIYEQLMETFGNHMKVLQSYFRFRKMFASWLSNEHSEKTLCTLRKAFMDTRNYYIIFEMALILDLDTNIFLFDKKLAVKNGNFVAKQHDEQSYQLSDNSVILRDAFLDRASKIGGSIEAMFEYAFMLEKGAGGLQKNIQKAIELYDRALKSDEHHTAAKSRLAELYLGADGDLDEDPDLASKLYKEMVLTENHIESMYMLAGIYARMEENLDLAIKLLQSATKLGSERDAINFKDILFLYRIKETGAIISTDKEKLNQYFDVVLRTRTYRELRDTITYLAQVIKSGHIKSDYYLLEASELFLQLLNRENVRDVHEADRFRSHRESYPRHSSSSKY